MTSTSSRPRSGPRPLVVALAVVVVILLVLAGLYARKVLTQDRVEVIGDSITVITDPVLHSELDGRHRVDIRAVSGMEIAQMQPAASEAAAGAPDQVVINLGTNDVIHGKEPGLAAHDLETMAAAFPSRCVHLVTINEGMVSPEGTDLHTPTVRLNQAIKDLAQRKGYHVVDWAKVAADYGAAGEPDGHLTTDTVHPDAAGQRLLADAVKSSVDTCQLLP